MVTTIAGRLFGSSLLGRREKTARRMDLTHAKANVGYTIKGIDAMDDGMKDFLFTLGCYEGEEVTVISVLAENYIIHVKGARYSIDADLARAILI